jgi:hypothetical protein
VYRGTGEQPASLWLNDHGLLVGGFWAGVAPGWMAAVVALPECSLIVRTPSAINF